MNAYANTTAQTQPIGILAEIYNDHQDFRKHFQAYKTAATTKEAHQYFNLFLWEVCRHSVTEELVFYPMLETKGEQGKKFGEESREDQRKMKVALEDLMKEKNEQLFDQKFEKAFQDLSDHMALEETQEFPFALQHFTPEQLELAGKKFALQKKIVPTRPHSEVPDRPMALEAALGLLIAPMDKFRDLFVDFPDKIDKQGK